MKLSVIRPIVGTVTLLFGGILLTFVTDQVNAMELPQTLASPISLYLAIAMISFILMVFDFRALPLNGVCVIVYLLIVMFVTHWFTIPTNVIVTCSIWPTVLLIDCVVTWLVPVMRRLDPDDAP